MECPGECPGVVMVRPGVGWCDQGLGWCEVQCRGVVSLLRCFRNGACCRGMCVVECPPLLAEESRSGTSASGTSASVVKAPVEGMSPGVCKVVKERAFDVARGGLTTFVQPDSTTTVRGVDFSAELLAYSDSVNPTAGEQIGNCMPVSSGMEFGRRSQRCRRLGLRRRRCSSRRSTGEG